MPIHFYHPNKYNTGFAAAFSDSANNDCIFATILKQSGWNADTKTGSFKDSKDNKDANVSVKLNDLEIAAFIDCIENGRPYSSFHDSETPKTIQFSPWLSKPTNPEEKPTQKGFSFSVAISNKEDSTYKNSLYIGFTFSEGRLIREYLINTLNSHFNKNRENFLNNLNKNS